MKIVQLCPYAMARPGGVQRHVRDLSAWLEARGHELIIIAPPAPAAAAARHGNLYEIGRSRSFGAHGTAFELSRAGRSDLTALVGELHGWGAQLVHMHTPWTPMLVWQVWRRLRLTTVTTIHATLPKPREKSLTNRYIRWAARHFLRNSNAVVVPSPAPLALLQGLLPGLAAHVLPPAVDLSPWRAAAGARPAGPLSVVFLGRLEERKGIDVLLDAWPRVAAAIPQSVLTIAGDGKMRDRVLARQGPQLRYAGYLGDAQAQALLGRSDIFVAPAPYGESYGLVLAEAMAAGAVPVAAANAGFASVMGDIHPQLLATPGDAGSLADCIISLAENRQQLNVLRDWAKGRAANSDISSVGHAYENLFNSII